MGMGHIDERGLVFPGIDVKLEFALNAQARGDDLTPDADKDARGQIAVVPRDQTAQNRRFARRPQCRHDCAFTLQGSGLFHLGDGMADLGPADQKIVQGVVDLVDLVPETFKRLILF